MVAVTERVRTWTAADLAALPNDPENRYELVEGRLVKMSPTYGVHGRRTSDLHFSLESHVRQHQLGVLTAAETGFNLTRPGERRETVLAPDIAFIRAENASLVKEHTMAALRIVFMGTPAFAVPSLQALLRLGEIDGATARVVGVFTQPDRPAGRGKRLTPPPVKEVALAAGIPVEQPERLRRPEAIQALQAMAPDLIVVAAYAQILSPRVLELPRLGCLNVHASLLPRYRGAAPIQAAILDGAPETGVCIMHMEAGLDTGPVLACHRELIRPDDTAESLGARLAIDGAELLLRTVPGWVSGAILPEAQDEAQATMTRPLRKEDGRIDWMQPAAYIERQVRAMYPWPGAYTTAGDALLKVLSADVVPGSTGDQSPGTLVASHEEPHPLVVTGDGLLALREVQPAGRRPMSGADWLRGAPGLRGTVLDAEEREES